MNINVLTGSQLDTEFLKKVCADIGPFDIIIDDGGHQSDMILTSFEALWLCVKDKGVYAIEDLHALSMYPNSDMYCKNNVCKDVYTYMGDLARAGTTRFNTRMQAQAQDEMGKHVASMSFYDSLAFLHFQSRQKPLERFFKGEFIHRALTNATEST